MANISAAAGYYDHVERIENVKAFDETKAGVKGLIDSGLRKLPKIFVRPADELAQETTCRKLSQFQPPVIDLTGISESAGTRKQIVEKVRNAAAAWGFFQVVNHDIPLPVLDDMIEAVQKFHEMDADEKKVYYSRESSRKVRFVCSDDLFAAKTADFRDTVMITFTGDQNDGDEFPVSLRKSSIEYYKYIRNLGDTLLELLSEALGLKSNHLKDMDCAKGHRISCHYHPACPEPGLAIGTAEHCDADFITILLQNDVVSALQVMYQGHWADIPPVRGALVVNIGYLLQLVSNGRFRSIKHRAIANEIGPRISVACFLTGPVNQDRMYGPIEELISEENPQQYKQVKLSEYMHKYRTTGLADYNFDDYYKLCRNS